MSGDEADEIYRLIIEVFPKTSPERAFRMRGHLFDAEVNVGIAREIVMRHRETHKYLEEPDLLADLAKTSGKAFSVDPAKVAAEQLRRDRRRKEQELLAAIAADEEECKKKLLELGPDELRRQHPGAAVVLKRLNLLPREGLVFGEVLTARRECVQA